MLAPGGAVFAGDCRYTSLNAWTGELRESWKASLVHVRRAGLRVIGGTVVAVTSTVCT